MSDVIKSLEKLNSRQMETVKRRGEREMKAMENSHQNIKAEMKKAHASEMVDIENQHHHQINQSAAKKEKVLSEMRNHLQQTQALTDKELKALKTKSEADRSVTQEKLSLDRQKINDEHSLYLEELSDRFDRESKKVHTDGQKRVEEMKLEKQSQLSETEAFNQKKINEQTDNFNTRFSTEARNYEKMKYQQDHQYKKERMGTNYRQQIEMKKMSEAHTAQIGKKDDHYRQGLKDQDLFFEKKYTDQLNRHQNDFKTLEDKNNKVLEELKTNLTTKITSIASKNDDPFYKFEALAPRLKEVEGGVEISVDVPEHSKQDVQISFNGKEAVISLNRRYSDANKTSDGTINKVSKVESFTTRITTSDVLDPKSVKSNYDNGTVTFTVKKA